MKYKAVFLDLNGTLVLPVKQESLSELKIIPGADIAAAKLIEKGFICPIVTIQSGIARGRFTEQEFNAWFSNFFRDLKLDVKGPYVCPHTFAEPCICKKPGPFLYEQAAKNHFIDLSMSYVIGDTAWDVIAGKNIGATSCLVKTGCAADESEYQNARPYASYTGETIEDIVKWILWKEKISE